MVGVPSAWSLRSKKKNKKKTQHSQVKKLSKNWNKELNRIRKYLI